jgi:hypothetical protein
MPSSTALLPDNTTRAAFHHDALREPVARQNRQELNDYPSLQLKDSLHGARAKRIKKPPANASGY